MHSPTYELFVVPLRSIPLAAIMPSVNSRKVFGELRPKLPDLIATFMTSPAFDAWIHERHIHKILRLSPSATHGQYHALSCIITTITTGKGGNSKKNTHLTVDSNYAHCTFDVSPRNVHQVAFQPYGRHESFDAGTLNGTVQMVPRWFRFGPSTCSDLSTQLAIVADAIGSSSELDDSTRKRRQLNFKSFYYHKEDDGYARNEVPSIAYKFFDYLHTIFKTPLNTQYIATRKDGSPDISRRAFDDRELLHFEGVLRKMIVASTQYGNLRVSNGDWVESLTDRVFSLPTNATITPRASSTQAVTPATTRSGQRSSCDFLLRRSNSTEIPDPLRHSFLGMLLFGLLLHVQLIRLI